MIKVRPSIIWIVCYIILLPIIAAGQYTDNGFLDAHFGKPVTFYSRDSSFSLGIGGRIQSLAETRYDTDEGTGTIDFSIRRLHLNFTGNAISPKFTYRIQLCFSQRDMAPDNSQVQNNLVLRDAMLYYSPSKSWRFGFGQTKLPGNRQRQTSSGNLQFVDRSNTNALFTLDRDKGLWITNTNTFGKKAIMSNTLAISSGEGRITSDRSDGLCYSFRSEILPFGAFKNNGDYVEADLYFEESLKLSWAIAYSFNNKTSRVAGQLGEYLFNGQYSDLHYYGTDVMIKKKGWSFTGELYRRTSKNGISVSSTTPPKVNFVYTGTGVLLQTGYLLTKKNEIAIRYGSTTPDNKIKDYISKAEEYVIAYSHYFFRHNLKVQTDVAYLKSNQKFLQGRFTAILTF